VQAGSTPAKGGDDPADRECPKRLRPRGKTGKVVIAADIADLTKSGVAGTAMAKA